ncbi:DIT2 Cytochrome P450-DIT2 [Candida maltosa Xu316]|uniref:Cytochrome P450-DIT2 n=1 Tax=Candida maltosa (strain Xu316) TaxID=1245528 RepID=M3IQ66_CANMX|nr:hypothetical protein G210_0818 [Candida maltosa Xu316]
MFSIIKYTFIGVITYLFYLILEIIFPPFNFPKNIPTIPFYVSFLGAYTNLDQADIYNLYIREKLEKYGAVKIYFASRWNILITKPEYLLEMFKNEDVFAKSGNHIKIPGSVLASYTGDNVISAHGELWKLYREVIAQSIQFPDLDPITKNTEKLIQIINDRIGSQKQVSIPVTDILQKYSLANVTESILGIDYKVLDGEKSIMHEKIKYVKSQIFNPFFLNFPYFDNFPIPSRLKARSEVTRFREWYGQSVIDNHDRQRPNSAGTKLVDALMDEKLTEKQFLDNAIILMVAGHENPLLLMLSLMYVLAKYPLIQETVRQETDPAKPYLHSVIYETLRMYPPLGMIINRCTTRTTKLGDGIVIPKGVYCGYNNFGTGRDRNVWGNNADVFKPERWGCEIEEINQKYSIAKKTANLPAFHGRKRACLGEKYALYEVKNFVCAIVGEYQVSVDASWNERITPAGPICPLGLKINFEKLVVA